MHFKSINKWDKIVLNILIGYHLACWVKISADEILKYFSYSSRKTEFDISSKLSRETICMKCQSLFSGKNKKNIIKLSPAESAHSMVSVKTL